MQLNKFGVRYAIDADVKIRDLEVHIKKYTFFCHLNFLGFNKLELREADFVYNDFLPCH